MTEGEKMKFLTTLLALLFLPSSWMGAAEMRPNILWITSEDNGPHLGAYGDDYATTPNLDRLASKGVIYLNAWSNAPVCAPARTTIISGLYPPSTGSEHMRSFTRLPPGMKMYPQFLREAGYFTSNRNKEDFNLEKPGILWEGGRGRNHWKFRKEGQPFFSIFNFTVSHESQIRKRPHKQVHDPARVRVPAYHPDTPEVRQDWAQYYDKLTEMDTQAGKILKELEESGLADETIIFYYGDHGPGMPRCKRWPYNSGLLVPLIVYIPEKFRDLAPEDYRPGGKTDRLVGFIDLAPTVLSLAGIKPPEYMQGHAFLGKYAEPEQPYLYGFRGRMDERYDMVRCVRDKRYIYIRNYMPHKIYGQYINYMFQTPTTRVWKELYDQGKLQPPRTYFWERKPPEELYDLQADPDEVKNLASSPEHRELRRRLRKEQESWALRIRDVGFLPEGEIHSRSEGSTPYEVGHDSGKYPLERILKTAGLASSLKMDALDDLIGALGDRDSAVRYWGAMGIVMRGQPALVASRKPLRKALEDSSPYVRIVAAEALAKYGGEKDLAMALPVLVKLAAPDKNDVFSSLLALNVLDDLDEKARSVKEIIRKMPKKPKSSPPRTEGYPGRVIPKILSDLK